ncbi:MAG TPA: tetratricopeptide repeat protein [Terriglobia bacterium]|nr:tetratricopeptide repeat protein [Terriglobia bacterium]
MSRVLRSVGLGLVMAFLVGAGSLWAQNGGLTGHVTLQDGSTCVKCPIIIERTSIRATYQTKTDKKGNYIYIGLAPDTYKVTLQDPEGKTLFFISRHIGIGEPTQVDFNLPKEVETQQKENPQAAQQAAAQQKEQQQLNSLKEVFNQGVAQENAKQWADAAATFQKGEALAKGNNVAVVLSHEAQAYQNAKMYDQAVATYQKLLAANPSDASAHNGLGAAYAAMNKLPEAQAEFQKAAQLDPASAAKAYYNEGAILSNSGKMDEAAAAFKQATTADPKFADAYFLEAQALMGKATVGSDGKVVPAPGTVEALQTYLQLDPKGKYAESAQAMLQSVTGSVTTDVRSRKKKAK